MQLIKRRSLIKLAGLGAFVGYIPWLNAQEIDSSNDVQFLKKDNKLYDVYRKIFNKRLELRPKVIAMCKTELGVQVAVRYANEHKLNINIKSGGHSFEGFSLNNDGMVIDVSHMSDLELMSDHSLVAEPAVRLAQLYGYCLPKGRLLPSGSCASVGLSGITLGGGYGLFAREFGLTCDYLTGVRMVDAQGDVIDSDDFPELLWACRGAGNGNFGVITQLRYKTVVAPETLYQHRFRSFDLTPQQAVKLAEFWFEQTNRLPNHAFSAFVLNGRTLSIMLTSTQNDEKMQSILHEFDSVMDKNYNLNPDPTAVGVQYYYGHSNPLYFKNISAGFYKDFTDIEGCAEAMFAEVANTRGAVFQINTLGGEINNAKWAKDSAYAHRDAKYLGEAQCYWENPNDMPRSMAAMKAIQSALTDNNVTKHYVNYPDLNIVDFEQAYYGDEYERLQKLKRVLDPENKFNYQQSIVG